MKKMFKKNQIIITALALMIAAAGYLSYTHSSIGDEGLKQTSAELTEEDYDIVYDETLVDADIFTETEVDTKIDEEAAADTKTDDAAADGKKTKQEQKKKDEEIAKLKEQLEDLTAQSEAPPEENSSAPAESISSQAPTSSQPAAARQPKTPVQKMKKSAIREKQCLPVQAFPT